MILRPYQEKCLEASAKAAANGVTRQLWVLATGLGKTVLVSDFIRRRGPQGTFGLMHREELLEQSKEKILAISPQASIAIEKASSTAFPGAEVILGSVQTVGRLGATRLPQRDWLRQLWIDEAHHAPADGYLRVADYFGLRAERGQTPRRDIMLVGTTATPDRLDRLGYDTLFDDVTFRYDLPDAIRDGWLADVRAWRIESDLDLQGIKTRQGDFAIGELGDAAVASNMSRRAVATWIEHGVQGPALFFCVNKAHAAQMTAMLEDAGANVACVTDETPADERRKTVELYKNNGLDAMVNVGVFTEGFDAPETRAIYILRPTKSRALYLQMLGRGTRLAANKNSVEVFDFTPGDALAAGPAAIFGLPDAWQLEGQSLLKEKAALEEIQQKLPLDLSRATSLRSLQARASRVELFKRSVLEDALPSGRLAWLKAPGADRWRIGWRNPAPHQLGRLPTQVLSRLQEARLDPRLQGARESLELFQNELGAWEVQYSSVAGEYRFCGKPTQREAIEAAEKRIDETRPHVIGLLRKGTAWRRQPASEKQVAAMKRRGVPPDIASGATKAEASALMDMDRSEIAALIGGAA